MASIGAYVPGCCICCLILVLVDVANCNQYDFGFFENFEVTRQSFMKEQNLVKRLPSVKGYYKTIVASLHQNTNNSLRFRSNVLTLYKMKEVLSVPLLIFNVIQIKKQQTNILLTMEFSERSEHDANSLDLRYSLKPSEVLKGCTRGLITLQTIYDINIQQLIEGSVSNDISHVSVRKKDFLKPDDLLLMSIIAQKIFQRTDHGLIYLNKAINMIYNMSIDKISILPPNFDMVIKSMFNLYSSSKNKKRLNKQTDTISDMRPLHYPINQGIYELPRYMVLLYFITHRIRNFKIDSFVVCRM